MTGIVNALGNTPRFPLESCKMGMFCKDPNCDMAIDAGGSLVYEGTKSHRTSPALKWSDIQNRPGWNNGWPPGMGKSNGGVWRLLDCSDDMDMTRYPISDDPAQICDCGAAAADYSISRFGGAGHSDWCKVYNRMV